MLDLFLRAYHRFRPRHGWLVFALLLATLACLVLSALEVEWVPNDHILIPAVLLGFVAAAVLFQRPIQSALVWLVLILSGAIVALVLVAELWPPLAVVRGGEGTLSAFWRLQWALFIDRSAGWYQAVTSGGSSTETVVFALLLALSGWLVAVLLAWSAYRIHKPYVGLTAAGLALAANTFYGSAGLYWAAIFFGLAVTAATYLHYLYREIEWERGGVDYSAEVRLELLTYAAGISLGIMSLALGVPSINFRAIAEVFQRQEAVVAAEQTLARAFAGVQQPRVDEGLAGGGGLPRSFLLGGDPELTETVVMTATIRPEAGVSAAELGAFHWRSISYDVYTGRGWARSPEREENVDSGQPIPNEQLSGQPRVVTVTQEVDWTYDRRATRYTLGRPIVFSHDLVVLWRGQEDFVGVRGRNNAPGRYTAQTRLNLPAAEQLRAARLADVPPQILARYTALPDSLPGRVRDLARQAVSAAPGAPYDQARAIEAFLHQYPYSLDLPTPPAGVDIVDYFLFDRQTGFCDYFASAMVVMARAVGLPARLGVGFLQAPADANGVQTVRQINAHSWAEVYFAGYGWVEFEPTPPFAGATPAAPSAVGTVVPGATFAPPASEAIAIPERAPDRSVSWLTLLGASALALVGWRLWGRRLVERLRHPPPRLDGVELAYARLQTSAGALGYPPHPARTPAEFAAEVVAAPALAAAEASPLRPRIERLAQLFAAHLYGREKTAANEDEASAIWDDLRDPLRRLVWRRRFRRQGGIER
jgi:transglutaminase-like putative cysteine protease